MTTQDSLSLLPNEMVQKRRWNCQVLSCTSWYNTLWWWAVMSIPLENEKNENGIVRLDPNHLPLSFCHHSHHPNNSSQAIPSFFLPYTLTEYCNQPDGGRCCKTAWLYVIMGEVSDSGKVKGISMKTRKRERVRVRRKEVCSVLYLYF